MTEELSFEQAFGELQQTLERLEDGDLPLGEALALYERGMELAALCDRRLNEAELRVRQISASASGGLEATELNQP